MLTALRVSVGFRAYPAPVFSSVLFAQNAICILTFLVLGVWLLTLRSLLAEGSAVSVPAVRNLRALRLCCPLLAGCFVVTLPVVLFVAPDSTWLTVVITGFTLVILVVTYVNVRYVLGRISAAGVDTPAE